MKQIQLQSLRLTNFKGIRNLEVNFSETETTICGDNATGKSTIFDAFTWLLFDKDSHGRTAFDIKTIDPETGETIPQIDHEVEGILMIDKRKVTLRKCYREKWVKKRGTAEATLDGHETICFFDEVMVAIGEYKRRISDIVEESLFKLTTDPAYFNRLDTADRRNVLIAMAGEITNEMIEGMRPDLAGVMALINGYKPDEIKKKLSYQKSLIKNEYDMIPARIDEKTREIVEQEDWDALQRDIEDGNQEINTINSQIEDLTKGMRENSQKIQNYYSQIAELDRQTHQITAAARAEVDRYNAQQEARPTEIRFQIDQNKKRLIRVENEKSACDKRIERHRLEIEYTEQNNNSLREEWTYTDGLTFHIDPEALSCPTCGADYPYEKADEIRESSREKFNKNKAEKLAKIEEQGIRNANLIQTLRAQIKEEAIDADRLKSELQEVRRDIEQLERELANTTTLRKEYDFTNIEGLDAIDKQQLELHQKIREAKDWVPETDVKRLQEQRAHIQLEVDQLNRRYGLKRISETAQQRIEDLKKQQREMAQQIADLEKEEFEVAEFFKTKLQEIEKTVNEHFSLVRFRLFEMQVNGTEKQVCDAMVNGVPYDSLNSATKINAGIDIINALSKHYEFRAPIFIDNRETVNELIPTESQIINLRVTRDNTLIFN